MPNEEKKIVYNIWGKITLRMLKQLMDKYSNYFNVIRNFIIQKITGKICFRKVTVKTPDETMDLMMNGWLMYQTIACRLWSRTAFYQSGGAYGFRDQLQDVMSLSFLKPEMTRNQILISASRQFLEGDVQHWWHPIVIVE